MAMLPKEEELFHLTLVLTEAGVAHFGRRKPEPGEDLMSR